LEDVPGGREVDNDLEIVRRIGKKVRIGVFLRSSSVPCVEKEGQKRRGSYELVLGAGELGVLVGGVNVDYRHEVDV
jgi:hypothetical protein